MKSKDKEVTIGTPTMVLLPARNYCFNVVKAEHKITIPRKGSYKDLDSSFYSEEDGEFNLLGDEENTMFLPSISKVLFGVKKYPDLKSNQLFAPVAMIFRKNTVDIIGQVIEMLDTNDSRCKEKERI